MIPRVAKRASRLPDACAALSRCACSGPKLSCSDTIWQIQPSPSEAPPTGRDGLMRITAGGEAGFEVISPSTTVSITSSEMTYHSRTTRIGVPGETTFEFLTGQLLTSALQSSLQVVSNQLLTVSN